MASLIGKLVNGIIGELVYWSIVLTCTLHLVTCNPYLILTTNLIGQLVNWSIGQLSKISQIDID